MGRWVRRWVRRWVGGRGGLGTCCGCQQRSRRPARANAACSPPLHLCIITASLHRVVIASSLHLFAAAPIMQMYQDHDAADPSAALLSMEQDLDSFLETMCAFGRFRVLRVCAFVRGHLCVRACCVRACVCACLLACGRALSPAAALPTWLWSPATGVTGHTHARTHAHTHTRTREHAQAEQQRRPRGWVV